MSTKEAQKNEAQENYELNNTRITLRIPMKHLIQLDILRSKSDKSRNGWILECIEKGIQEKMM